MAWQDTDRSCGPVNLMFLGAGGMGQTWSNMDRRFAMPRWTNCF